MRLDADEVTEWRLADAADPAARPSAWYSGKAHEFAGNIQALMTPNGIPMWTSEVYPGSEHDITMARAEVLTIAERFLADSGYEGAEEAKSSRGGWLVGART